MTITYNRLRFKARFQHYESIQGMFYNRLHDHRIVSVNGFAVDIDRLDDDFRIVRFVRDPRDLIVSGYFYHRRGAEPWFRMRSPTAEYWQAINGCVPQDMPPGISFAEYLESLSTEEGLKAEIDFRAAHLQSLRDWQDDDRIRIYKYESILGNERRIFADIADFYGLSLPEKTVIALLAERFSSRNRRSDTHIRNPSPGQWQEHFTPAVAQYFDSRYSDLIRLLDY